MYRKNPEKINEKSDTFSRRYPRLVTKDRSAQV